MLMLKIHVMQSVYLFLYVIENLSFSILHLLNIILRNYYYTVYFALPFLFSLIFLINYYYLSVLWSVYCYSEFGGLGGLRTCCKDWSGRCSSERGLPHKQEPDDTGNCDKKT